jgi:hypothetical protein
MGLAHQKQLKFGLALKRYKQVYNHFLEFLDDQLDFYPYAMRKQTFRSFVDVVTADSKLNGHHFFVSAAKGAITTYMIILEGGQGAELMVDGVSLVEHSASERKKILSKARKAELKRSNTDISVDSTLKKNDDPYGAKFVVDVNHIAEAEKFLKPLLRYASNDLEVFDLATRLYIAKSRNPT